MWRMILATVAVTVGLIAATFAFGGAPAAPEISSVVHLLDKDGRGFCTGFHVGDGYIVSAGHCHAAGVVTVGLSDGTKRIVRVAAMSNPHYGMDDFMVLKITASFEGIATDTLACAGGDYPVGEPVRVTGYPGDLGEMTMWGRIAGKPSPLPGVWGRAVLRMNLSVLIGLSGAPVYTESDGKVIGILAGAEPDNRTLSMATPISAVCAILQPGST